MAFFNTVFENSTNTELDILGESGYLDNTYTDEVCFEEAVATFDTEMMQLEAAMYIADIQMETAVFEGASIDSMESVLENALTDFIKKVKDGIISLWQKFQDFVTKVLMNIKSFTSTSANFVSKHKADILAKTKDGKTYEFKYSGYKFDEAMMEKGKKKIDDIGAMDVSRIKDLGTDPHAMASWYYGQAKEFNPVGEVNDMSGVVSAFMKAARGKQVTDEKPERSDIEKWVGIVSDSNTTLKSIGESKLKAKRAFDTALKTLKEQEKKANKNNNSSDASEIRAYASMASKLASASSRMAQAVVTVYSDYYKTYTKRLKAYAGLSEKKAEAANASFASGADSLLASAFEML